MLAATLEHEWSDFLFPNHTSTPEKFGSQNYAHDPVYYPSPFYRMAANLLSQWLENQNLEAVDAVEIGGAAGRFAHELMSICPRIQSYLMTDPNEEKIQWARWLFSNSGESAEVPVAVSQTQWECRNVPHPALGERPWLSRISFAARGLESPEWTREGADLVTCLNVIDHAENPANFMNRLGRLLKPGGLLFLASPLDWHTAYTPRPLWKDRLDEFFGREWVLLERSELPFHSRTRPRRLIVFASEIVLARKA